MHSSIQQCAERLLKKETAESTFLARQLMFSVLPPSYFVENYLFNNEGELQNLDGFPMLKQIYDNVPRKLLLKCSRKTLKSTLISNFICLNMIRWNYYKMLYVGPQETTVKYFSGNYLPPRFESPKIKELLIKGWDKNDVFEKKIADTKSSCLFRYVKDDASRVRGPAVDCIVYDEVQDIFWSQIGIIQETMTMSKVKREIFAGTPLDTTNTLHKLWKDSNQLEWMMKCPACGHWNGLIESNDPMSMIRKEGFSCSKCARILNSRDGEWVSFNPANTYMTGYHLAQPILPHFNETEKEWMDIYIKCNSGKYDTTKVMNEVFGLVYDVGTKPITETELRKICVLDGMYQSPDKVLNNKLASKLAVFQRNKGRYKIFTVGVDWGVSMLRSRTVATFGAIRNDGKYEVFFIKIFTGYDHESHIREIAALANELNAYCVADSGPDPIRGIKLCELTSPTRSQLATYRRTKVIQQFDSGEYDWRQNRWVLHRSDTISLVIRMMKEGKILFPSWDDTSEYMQDILNIYVEVKDGLYGHEMHYTHKDDQPDDALHSLNFAVCAALMAVGDVSLLGPSSTAKED